MSTARAWSRTARSAPVHRWLKILFEMQWRQIFIQLFKRKRLTFALEDGDLRLYPAAAWEIVRNIFACVFDCHSFDEPIAVKHAAIIFQGNHQNLTNSFGRHAILVRLSSFEVVVEPFVQGQRISFTICTLTKWQFVRSKHLVISSLSNSECKLEKKLYSPSP